MVKAKLAAKAFLASRWGWRATQPLRPRGTAVLMYHRVGPITDPFPTFDIRVFRAQMEWLKTRCRVIAPEELADVLARPTDERTVLLTFDDGYKSYFDHVYPILAELRLPSLVFPSTAFVDDPARRFAWDTLYLATQRTSRKEVRLPWGEEPIVSTHDTASRRRFYAICRRYVKHLRGPAQTEMTARLLDRLGVESADLEVPRQVLTWDEVRATMPLTRYGGHTHTHPIMSQLDSTALEFEIRLSQERIAQETGVAPRFFAYPNGGVEDFTQEAKILLRRHGFEIAFSAIEGLARPNPDWMAVRRFPQGKDFLDMVWLVAALRAPRKPVAVHTL
jgi:peptidoglycan/xylan/chitin deacetylase (PgdA/CDA1 family)